MAAGRESVMARPAGRAAGPSRRGVQVLGGVAGLLCALVGWLYLAPAQIGGATSYAVVVGSSMEPKLGAGDLVLVRPQARYEAGDVVLYDDPQLRSKVLAPHRAGRRRALRPQGRQQRLSRQHAADGGADRRCALGDRSRRRPRHDVAPRADQRGPARRARDPRRARRRRGRRQCRLREAAPSRLLARHRGASRRRRSTSRQCSRLPAWPSRSSPWSPSRGRRPVS